jgi:hypothetical protein
MATPSPSKAQIIATDDTKTMIFLLIVSLIIVGICIACAIDFQSISNQNQDLPTTYFSSSFATAMAVINWIIVVLSFGIFFYSIYRITQKGKLQAELEREIGAKALLDANRRTKSSFDAPVINIQL